MTDTVKLLSDVTVHAKYAKYVPELQRRETWEEVVSRNLDMHVRKFPHLEEEIRDAYEFVYEKKVLPSMRSLQFGGLPIEVANNRIYNCAYMPIDDMDAFSELMFLLLGGTGGGYSVQSHHTNQLPVVVGPTEEVRKFLIPDSIEGWSDAVKVLVESHYLGKHTVKFDYRDIREKGEALITTGGKAPGPEPLRQCIGRLDEIFKANKGTRLRPIVVHDICCIIADAVLAGGIRRAALISLFDRYDEEILTCKGQFDVLSAQVGTQQGDKYYNVTLQGVQQPHYPVRDYDVVLSAEEIDLLSAESVVAWYHIHPHRGRANNSAVLPRGKVSREEFYSIMKKVEESQAGEPGVYWTSDINMGTNPCCEIALQPFQFCNLCDVNVSNVIDQEDYDERAKVASFIGTLQATYTDFHYLRPIWKETTEKEALIGAGLTGIGSGKVLDLNLREASSEVVKENERAAKLFGINPAARTTTVKPSGTSSLVVGSSSGIHAWHNNYYLRRMRMGVNDALYKYVAKKLPRLVEPNAILAFPQKAPEGGILRTESMQDLLDRVRRFNLEWVRHGHNSGANTHNVSCTISVKEDQWEEITEWMWENRNEYNGISVMPYDGGTYEQAPFEDITEAEYLELEEYIQSVGGINLKRVIEEEDNTDLQGEQACAGGQCEI